MRSCLTRSGHGGERHRWGVLRARRWLRRFEVVVPPDRSVGERLPDPSAVAYRPVDEPAGEVAAAAAVERIAQPLILRPVPFRRPKRSNMACHAASALIP